jgi:hypothetical protein
MGRIFDPTAVRGIPWMKEFAQGPSTLIFDNFVRVYICCRPPRDANGNYVSRAGYVDLNRNNLLEITGVSPRAIMELGEPGMFDEFGTYPVSVIRKRREIWAYYGGWTRCESVPFDVAIGCAVSQDNGVSFEKMGSGPILSYSLDEPFVLSGPKIRNFGGQWQLWYIAGKKWLANPGARPEPVYRIRMASSHDGVAWEKRNADLIPVRIEEDECQASPDVFFWNGRYHMFFCYRHSIDYRNGRRGYRVGYAFSDDMESWTRDDRRAGIDVSAEGWDSEMISYPHVFELDGSIYMMYLGNEVGRYGFGLAQLEGELS